jgi:hypothetical protein
MDPEIADGIIRILQDFLTRLGEMAPTPGTVVLTSEYLGYVREIQRVRDNPVAGNCRACGAKILVADKYKCPRCGRVHTKETING